MDINCCICNDFVAVSPVIHHCHSTGKVLGITHSNCNFRAQTKRILPVLFHNLSRYDAYHILKSLIVRPGEKISAISRTDEAYISFSLRIKFSEYICKDGRHVPLHSEIRFLDSFQFMSQSLESLAKTMQTSSLQLLRNKFSDMSDFDFPLQVFGQLRKIFPTLSCLRGRLEKQFVWKNRHKWTRIWKGKWDLYTDALQHLWWLHDFYLTLDVYLLADISESLRGVCHLDPLHFFFSSKLELGRNVEYH